MREARIAAFGLALAAGWAITPAAVADEALAKKHNCTACHAVDKKMVGPAYKDVAKKYKGQADAAAKLETVRIDTHPVTTHLRLGSRSRL